ncbi:MAG: glycosyltransferase family 2 protein, partial [Planctomycetota bacterium]
MTDSDEADRVSAVLVNFNGGEKVLTALRHLRDQRPRPAEIIVVDNGSTDGSPARIRAAYPEVVLVELGENRGLPAGRNVGVRRANTDLVLLVDVDVYLDPGALERLLRAHAGTACAVVCPRVLLMPDRGIVQCDGAAVHFCGTMILRHAYRSVAEAPEGAGPVDGCIGACMLVDRRIVQDAGGFDEGYLLYFEDHEFCLRLRSLGHDIYCDPGATVFHDRGEIPGLSFRGRGEYPKRRAYVTLRERLRTMLIHYRLRTLVILAPALAVYELSSFAIALARGWPHLWFAAWWWQVRRAGELRARRCDVQRRRT